MKRLVLLAVLTVACNRTETVQPAHSGTSAATQSVGNAQRGKELIGQYGCAVCHAIPGIEGPQGSLGPSLAGLASRPTITQARVENTPGHLIQFIENPTSVNPQSSMPPIGVAAGDAQDIAGYLLTLK